MSVQPSKQTRKCDSNFAQKYHCHQLSIQHQANDTLDSCSSKEDKMSSMQIFQDLKTFLAASNYEAKVSKVSDKADPIFVSIGSGHKKMDLKLFKVDVTNAPVFRSVFSLSHISAMHSSKTGSEYLKQRKSIFYIDKAICKLGVKYPDVVVQHVAKSSTREILWDSKLKIVTILKSGKWRFYDLTTGKTLAEIKTYALPELQHFV